ncbi:MAG TPA: hypothetical protein VFM16_03530 [Holophagaceae bacterium]|nr:hypothetical protein [Holophagaceae bacterium]
MAEVAEAGEARALPPEEPAYGRALRTRPGAAWSGAAGALLLLALLGLLAALGRPRPRPRIPSGPMVLLLLPEAPLPPPLTAPRGGAPSPAPQAPVPLISPGPLEPPLETLDARPAPQALAASLQGPLLTSAPPVPHGAGSPGAGAGRGPGAGGGDGPGVGSAGRGILKLRSSARPHWSTRPLEAPKDGDRVEVRLLVGADGVPFKALPLSGRMVLYPAVLQAARKWRFDVPPGYASLAPFQVTVDFTYRLGGDSSSQVQELRPVELR